MSAFQAHLDQEFQEAVMAGVLSLEEAWLLQDQLLINQSEWVEVPSNLQPQMEKLAFFQARPHSPIRQ